VQLTFICARNQQLFVDVVSS